LKPKRALTLLASLALTAIIVGCFVTQLYEQQNFHYTYTEGQTTQVHISSLRGFHAVTINEYTFLGVTPALTVQAPAISQTTLVNTTRSQIYTYINQNPGVGFRALASALCLPVGLAEYHLGVLVRSGLVSFVRDGRYKRFFIAKRFSKRDMALICLLRHGTTRRILEALRCRGALSHGKLAGEVAITSQALTWQMKNLKSTQLIVQVNDGLKIVYSLNDASAANLEKCLAVVA
jgi:predicted transcriptional regulator